MASLLQLLVRKVLRSADSSQPDMANTYLVMGQIVVSSIMVIAVLIVFLSFWIRLKKSLSVIDESDQLNMAALQQEIMGSDLPALTGESIIKLLELWGVILVGVQIIYDICSIVYRNFIMNLLSLEMSGEGMRGDFVTLYNSTHGFKYISMLIALLLGLFMTGIFLDDRLLKVVALILITFFLISFAMLEMQTISIGGYSIGIVWSSLIFHFTDTIGLACLGIYLKRRYIGV